MTTAPPLKVGLIGLGNMGQNHLRVLSMLKNVDLRFIHDADTKRSQQLAKQYDVRCSVDLDDDLGTVDAVVLVTPTSTHFDYIKKIGNRVSAIFVEKPLTDDLRTSKEVLALAKEKKLRIQTGFIERYNPAVVVLKQVVASAQRVVNIDFTRTNKVSSRITDVDVVTDLMIHDIDLALFLNGPSKQVSAYGVIEDGMIAYARAAITHENGAFSNITASRITEKRIRQISVTCDEMYVDCNLLRKEVVISKQSLSQTYENVSISSQEESIHVRPEEALLSELMTFVRFAASGDAASVPTELDGYNAMEIAHQVQEIIRGRK